MTKARSDVQKLIALVLGVLLLIGGIADLAAGSQLLASKIGSFIAIGAGLVFLTIAARKHSKST